MRKISVWAFLAGAALLGPRAHAQTQAAAAPSLGFSNHALAVLDNPLDGKVAVGYAVVPTRAGRILVAGVLFDASGAFHLAVLRFNGDGTMDTSFGSGGAAYSASGGWGSAMAMDGRGRIVVAGLAGSDFNQSGAAILSRFLPDGSPDPGFSQGGLTQAAGPYGGRAAAYGVALDGDKILAAGAITGQDGQSWGAVWRFLGNGLPDVSFGDQGVAVLPAPSGQQAVARSLLVNSDGSALVGGTLMGRAALWEISSRGRLESGAELGAPGQARAMVLASGAVWLGGIMDYENPLSQKTEVKLPALSRFGGAAAADGAAGLAPSGSEVLPTPAGFSKVEAFTLAASPQGGFYAAGYAGAKSQAEACFWALDSAGRAIPSFGSGGVFILPSASGGGDDRVYAMAVDGQGRILATGFSRDKNGLIHLALWRLRPRE